MKSLLPKYRTTCFTFACTLLLLTACNRKVTYNQWTEIEHFEWHQDSTLSFNIEINDTNAIYSIDLGIRHLNQYSYQNLWVFTELDQPDSISFPDTMQFKLADQYGVWYGNRSASKYNYTKAMYSNIKFNTKGLYRMKINHGMRDEQLYGISSIGVKVIKN